MSTNNNRGYSGWLIISKSKDSILKTSWKLQKLFSVCNKHKDENFRVKVWENYCVWGHNVLLSVMSLPVRSNSGQERTCQVFWSTLSKCVMLCLQTLCLFPQEVTPVSSLSVLSWGAALQAPTDFDCSTHSVGSQTHTLRQIVWLHQGVGQSESWLSGHVTTSCWHSMRFFFRISSDCHHGVSRPREEDHLGAEVTQQRHHYQWGGNSSRDHTSFIVWPLTLNGDHLLMWLILLMFTDQ